MKKLLFFLLTLMAFTLPWAANAQQSLPYSYGFEDNNLSADGWIAQVTSSSSGIKSSAKHNGTYGFVFNYSEENGYLLSPILTGTTNGVILSFYYKEYSNSYGDEQFYVGYTTDESNTDPSTYTYGDIVTASTSWQMYEDLLPAGTKRVAIKYVFNDAFYLYLDDFTFEAAPSCWDPTGLTATDLTTSSATLGWTSTASNFNVRYRTAQVEHPFFFDDFESGLSQWTIYTDSEAPQSNGWYTINPISGLEFEAHSVTSCASSWSWNNSEYDADNWLVSPQVPLTGTLKFWVRTNASYPDQYEVLLSTTTNDESSFTVTLQAMAAAPAVAEWTEVVIDLSAYSGNGYIAIHHVDYDMNYLLIDDFGIYDTPTPAGSWTITTANTNSLPITGLSTETTYDFEVQANCGSDGTSNWTASTFTTNPSCMPVSNLAVAAATTTSITLSWTDDNSGSATYVVTDNDDNAISVTSLTTTGCTITGLTANTAYTFKVKANCGGGYSTAETINCRTECNSISTLPYEEDCEADGIYCWTTYGFGWQSESEFSHSGNRSIFSQSDDPAYAILPVMDDNISDLQLNFWWTNYYEGYDLGTLYVGYVTDADDYSTFVSVGTIDMSSSSGTFTQSDDYIFDAAPAGSRMAIKYILGTDASLVIIDDITVSERPACVKPTNLTVEGGKNAVVTWAGDAESFDIAYSTDNTVDPADNIVDNTTGNTFNLGAAVDLTEGDYYVWVRGNCGTDGYSDWTSPVSFHVGFCTPNPTSHDGSGITGVSFGTGDYVVTNGDGSASLPATSPYYGDYTSMIGAVQAGVESTIAITTNTSSWPYTFVIWVDLDNDMEFEDSEILYIGKAASGSGTLNATITIPAVQAMGDYRMRIYGADSYFTSFYNNGTTNWSAAHDPCSSGTYRHAHDYTVRVLEAPACLAPNALAATPSTDEAELSWTANNGETEWTLYYKKTTDGSYTEVPNVTDNPYTLTGLDAATEYVYYVVANCSSMETSDPSASFTFTTECEAFTITKTVSYTQDFEAPVVTSIYNSTTDLEVPSCWKNPYTTGSSQAGKPHLVKAGSSYNYSADQVLLFYGYGNNYITLPEFTNTLNTLQISFKWATESNTNGTLALGYITAQDSNYNTFTVIKNYAASSASYHTLNADTVMLDTLPGTATRLAFRWYYSGQYSCNIDDIEVSLLSSCPAPTGLAINNITDHGASLSWDAEEGEKFQFEMIPLNFYDPDNISWCSPTTTHEVSYNNFNANTEYVFSLRKICGEEDTSSIITRNFITPSPCLAPTTLACTDTTTTTATLSWTETGSATTWQICLNGDEENLIMANSNPFTLDGLTAATSYTAKVRAYCDTEFQSEWSAVYEFTTLCGVITITDSWSENFNSLTAGIPYCWDNSEGTTTTASYRWNRYATGHEGIGLCFDSYNNAEDNTNFLKTPIFNFATGKVMQLTFWYKNPTGGDFSVYISTDGGNTYTTELATDLTGVSSWTQQEIPLSNYVDAQNVVIVFKGTSNWGSGDAHIYLDDVAVVQAPSCLKPAGLGATANALSATITWVSEVDNYEIAHATNATADPNENIAGTATEETYTMNNLALGDHYFWVRANCGSDGYSDWVGPKSVYIGYCVPAPSSVDGNGISNVTFGMGENIVNNDSPKAYYADYTSEIGAVQAGVEATIAITYAHTYDYGTFIWVDLNNDLDFDEDEILYYGLSAGGNNPHTLDATITIPATQTPGDYVMRIGGADSGFNTYESADPCYTGTWACFQDYTLRVLEAPSCLTPTNVTITNSSSTTATVTWEGGSGTYNVEYKAASDENWTTGATAYNGTGITITQLTPATTYTVRVQSFCSDSASDWRSTSFTTLACDGGHIVEYTLNDSYGDGWSGNAIQVVEGCGNIIETLTIEDGASNSGTLNLCGDYYEFVWVNGSYPGECSFTFSENGTELFTKPSNVSDGLVLYTLGTQSCPVPTVLTAGTPDAHSVELSWTENGSATSWEISTGDDENPISITLGDVTIDVDTISYTLTGLTADAEYTVKVRANCSTEHSCWSGAETFTTAIVCARPEDLEATNITTTGAEMSWTGTSDSYVLQYRPWSQVGEDQLATEDFVTYTYDLSEFSGQGSIAIRHYDVTDVFYLNVDNVALDAANGTNIFTETFESGTIPASWTNYDVDGDGYTWEVAQSGSMNVIGNYGVYSASWISGEGALTPDNWLIIPNVELGGTFSFAARGQDPNFPAENFAVYVSLESDITEVPIAGTTYTATNLTPGTPYSWQVKGICGGDESRWVTSLFKTKDNLLIFADNGNWNDLSNWTDVDGNPATALPTSDNKVRIDSAAIIPNGVIATAGKTTIGEKGSITIEDGGQLKHNSATLWVTMEKNITGYGVGNEEDNDSYKVISTPFSGTTEIEADGTWSHVNNLATDTYDLYAFDPTQDSAWVNYEAHPYHDEFHAGSNYGLVFKRAYLYSNEENRTVSFTGTISKSVNASMIEAYDFDPASTDAFNGWKLVGNPFSCNAYINYVDAEGNLLEADLFVLNAAGDGFELATSNELAPLTGAFLKVNESGIIQFSTEPIAASATLSETNVPCLPTGGHNQTTDQDANCPNSCVAPINLVVSGETTNTVDLGWMENNGATAWQIMLNGDDANLIDVDENPYTIEGLTPNTTYTVNVRSVCEEGVYSDWSESVGFETEAIPYKLYFNEGSGVCETGYLYGATVTLPMASSDCQSFVGWTTDPVGNETSEPSTLYPGGSSYLITEDHYLYAVYTDGATYTTYPECCTISSLPYERDFEEPVPTGAPTPKTEVKPECMIFVYPDVAMVDSSKMQLYEGHNHSASGSYSMFLRGRGIFALPKYSVTTSSTSPVNMSFYLTQTKCKHQLLVGLMTDLTDESTFTPLATFDNGCSTEMQYYELELAANSDELNGKYIAFRNIINPTSNTEDRSYNWLDDIRISLNESSPSVCAIDHTYSEDFENITANTSPTTGVQPECWRKAGDPSSLTTSVPQVSYNTNGNGSYNLYMSGQCTYVMPQYVDATVALNTQVMNLTVRQKKYAHELEVGVMSDPSDESTFELVAVINNGNTTTPVACTVDFTTYEGTGSYIAFRNTVVSGSSSDISYNWIDDISFSDKVSEVCGIEVRYEENFDGMTSRTKSLTGVQPECWTLATGTSLTVNQQPQVYYNSNFASSGSYSLYMSIPCLYVMPEIISSVNVNELQMSLTVKQKKFSHQLEIGVMDDPTDESTFVLITTINNGDNIQPQESAFDFSAYTVSGKYIAFRNTVLSGYSSDCSYNWIDDINISLNTGMDSVSTEVAQTPSENTNDIDFDSYEENSEEPFNAPNAISNIRAAQLSLYPNPTTGKVTLVAEEVTMVEVYSQIGSKLATFTLNGEHVIDLGDLPKGVYILRVTMPEGVAVRKVVRN